MHKHPIIGITADYQEKVNCYSKYPWFALRKHYTKCLEMFECIPVILPISKNIKNIDFLDGLLISGFSLSPEILSLGRYDALAQEVGLCLAGRWSTWQREPFDGETYVVSAHRKT